MWTALHLALALLTRLPLPAAPPSMPRHHGQAVAAYPLVGLILGGVLTGAGTGLESLPPLVGAALLLLLWVLLTGGLHLDGLADSADAWIGGMGNRERTLTIMKDPHSGPAAITTLILTLLVKFATLASLPPHAFPLLLLPPVLGRGALTALFLTLPYVRAEGMGAMASAHLPRRIAWAILLLALALPPMGLGMIGAVVTGGVMVGFLGLRRALHQRLGGFTGDGAGAVCELTETLTLVLLAGLLS